MQLDEPVCGSGAFCLARCTPALARLESLLRLLPFLAALLAAAASSRRTPTEKPILASLPHSFDPVLAYLALAGLVGGESLGLPLPGETALIAAAVVSANGSLHLGLVIAVAALAAIVGDSTGYLIGRKGGRRLLTLKGPLRTYRLRLLERGEPFFQKHGPKAVFLGRWFTVLRITAAWLAGINRMHWPRFLFWNALGGVTWAATVGLVAFFIGRHAERLFKLLGAGGAVTVVVALAVVAVVWRWRQRRRATSSQSRD